MPDREERWQPIETLPLDGTLVLVATRNGAVTIIPAKKRWDIPVAEKRQIYEHSGDWPNAGWTPTHWMPLPDPPLTPSDEAQRRLER